MPLVVFHQWIPDLVSTEFSFEAWNIQLMSEKENLEEVLCGENVFFFL